jgi:hypothetical protein
MEINVYPTPAHKFLIINLSLKVDKECEIKLISLAGVIVFCDKIKNYADFQNYSIDVSNIAKGNYILSVSFKGKTWSRYVLLQ